MKDTLYIGTFLGVVAGFWFFLQKTDFKTSPITPSAVSTSTAVASASATVSSTSLGSQHHEKRSQSNHSTTQINGKTEGSSGHVTETETLPSIYARKGSKEPKVNARKHLRSHKGKASALADKVRPKMIHGVPLDQWIEWNKNQLRLGEVPTTQANGMRLFVQCMEIKKGGPQSVAQTECKSLATKAHAIPGATY